MINDRGWDPDGQSARYADEMALIPRHGTQVSWEERENRQYWRLVGGNRPPQGRNTHRTGYINPADGVAGAVPGGPQAQAATRASPLGKGRAMNMKGSIGSGAAMTIYRRLPKVAGANVRERAPIGTTQPPVPLPLPTHGRHTLLSTGRSGGPEGTMTAGEGVPRESAGPPFRLTTGHFGPLALIKVKNTLAAL